MSAIVADLQRVLERCFDRWEDAFAAARQQDYTTAEFAKDVAEGWMDAAYMSMLAGARLTGLKLETTTSLPLMRFIVMDKTVPVVQVIRVYRGAVPQNENLTKPGGQIAAGQYLSALATDGKRYLFVTLNCPAIDAAGTAAGVYEGNVRDQVSNAPIARVVVVWPG